MDTKNTENTLDIGVVVRMMKMFPNTKFTRKGWNGKDQYIQIQIPDEHSKMSLPYVYIKTVQGDLVPWLASQTDLLADDWVEVKSTPLGLIEVNPLKCPITEDECKRYRFEIGNQPNPDNKDAKEECYDAINRPAHYCKDRKIQPIQVIEDWKLGFNLGSALKYISRAGRKDDRIQDLEKAVFYLNREIEIYKELNKTTTITLDTKATAIPTPQTPKKADDQLLEIFDRLFKSVIDDLKD